MNPKHILFATAALLSASTAALAAPVSYTVEPTHTSILSESRHFGTSTVRARFLAKGGNITIDPAAKTGKATIVIDIASVDSGVAKLDTHLKGGDFFDAAAFPEATFTAGTFQFDGDKVVSIAGDLTMRGKTAPVTLKATNYNCYMSPGFKKQVCGGDFEATIQRSQWDVKYGIPFVPDDTRLVIQIEATKD